VLDCTARFADASVVATVRDAVSTEVRASAPDDEAS
jgi:hypothetical protein